MQSNGRSIPIHSLCEPRGTKSSLYRPAMISETPHFDLFPLLPVELRIKIWEEALVVDRVLTLRTNFDFHDDWTEQILHFEGKERSPISFCPCRESGAAFSKNQVFSCANHTHTKCRNGKFLLNSSRDILYLRKLSSYLDILSLHYDLAPNIIHPMWPGIRTLAIDFRVNSFEDIEALASVPYFFRSLEILMVIVGNGKECVIQPKELFELNITRITKKGNLELDWCELRREHGKTCKVPPNDVRESMLETLLTLVRSFTYFKELHPHWKMPKIKFAGVKRGGEGRL